MFATDGEMPHYPAKSALMSILEKLPASADEYSTAGQDTAHHEERMRDSVIDAMADKPEWIRFRSHLVDRIFEKYGESEIHLVFDW